MKTQVKAQDRQQQLARALCELTCFPAMTDPEIRAHLGVGKRRFHYLRTLGRRHGYPTRRDHWRRSQPPTRRDPSRDEWLWRIQHQSLEQIEQRFGPDAARLIEEEGIGAYLPKEWTDRLGVAAGPRLRNVTLVTVSPVRLRLLDSEMLFCYATLDEVWVVDRIVGELASRKAIPPNGWFRAAQVVDFQLLLHRHRQGIDPRDMAALNRFYKLKDECERMIAELPYPDREPPNR